MQLRLLFNALLICSSTMHAMELTTANYSGGIGITDDIFVTAVCSRLDRPTRDILRCTCKKYLTLVHSQDALNENYNKSLYEGDALKMVYWENLGWLPPHQEFANAVKNKKNKLAVWLLEKKKVTVWDAYCSNILEAVKTSTIKQILPVIKWLWDTRKPLTHLDEYLSGYHFAKNLIGLYPEYPEVQKIVDAFERYEQEEAVRKATASNSLIKSYFGSGPWHSRMDYY